jgi:hypothetical protein
MTLENTALYKMSCLCIWGCLPFRRANVTGQMVAVQSQPSPTRGNGGYCRLAESSLVCFIWQSLRAPGHPWLLYGSCVVTVPHALKAVELHSTMQIFTRKCTYAFVWLSASSPSNRDCCPGKGTTTITGDTERWSYTTVTLRAKYIIRVTIKQDLYVRGVSGK